MRFNFKIPKLLAFVLPFFMSTNARAELSTTTVENVTYYQIGNADELYEFAEKLSSNKSINGLLTADITVNENVLDADGKLNLSNDTSSFRKWKVTNNFKGILDGNKHTISGLFGVASGVEIMGFISFNEGTIKNLGITDSYFEGNGYVGGITCLNLSGALIRNCYCLTNIVSKSNINYAGGIAGKSNGTIENCYYAGVMSGVNYGGICGAVGDNSTITNCYFNSSLLSGEPIAFKNAVGLSSSSFLSGEAAYKLNQGQSAIVWGQKIGTEACPVFNSSTVYQWFSGCSGNQYTNDGSMSGASYEGHALDDHYKCKACGQYAKPSLVDGYYQIGTPSELFWFADSVNKGKVDMNAVLTADIAIDNHVYYTNSVGGKTMNPESYWVVWSSIGTEEFPYKGSFDGKGFTVSGMYVKPTQYAGLFGVCDGANISNVVIGDNYVYSSQYSGGVCAYLKSGFISNCSNTNSNSITSKFASGGICGHNGGMVSNCSNSGSVYGYVSKGESKFAGGICGENASVISKCYNTGTVEGDTAVGGICGYNMENASISRCYNTGSVKGDINVAGICGDNSASISLCYNKGDISSTYNAGGIAGGNVNGSVNNCYDLGKVSGTSKIGGICGENGYDDTHKGSVSNSYVSASISYVVNGGTVTRSNVVGTDSKGAVTNCYAPRVAAGMGAVYETSDTKIMRDSFAFGTVAYLLQKDQAEVVWGQKIGTDTVPSFSSDTVYKASCAGGFVYTNNKSLAGECSGHRYNNGICEICKAYTEPNLVDGVYQISDAGNLYWFAQYANAGNTGIKGVLVNDIVVNQNVLNNGALNVADTASFFKWTPICQSQMFSGEFDGANHSISGLFYNHVTYGFNYVGLFGQSSGYIKNLTVKDSYLAGWEFVGAIVGSNNGIIDSCFNVSTVKGSEEVGGICGVAAYGAEALVQNCGNSGYVYAHTPSCGVGGIAGRNGVNDNSNGLIDKCYNNGIVETSGGTLGGICGYNQDVVSNCYNVGALVCTYQAKYAKIGGICGSGNSGSIKNCFACATYDVTEEPECVGHISAKNNTVSNCYFDSTLFNFSESVEGVNGLPTDSFRTGMVAYWLQNGQSEQVWGQEIGVEVFPVLGGKPVYRVENPNETFYMNNHAFVNGICSLCGQYEKPELVNGAYQIENAGELYWFASLVNDSSKFDANAVLTADITFNSNVLNEEGWLNSVADTSKVMKWSPIAPSTDEGKDFTGNFDGQKHVIRGLFCKATRAGLFGIASGKIQNLGVEDSYFESSVQCGAVCAIIKSNGIVSNCYGASQISFDSKSTSAGRIGCVCGYNSGATVDHCYGVGRVSSLPRNYGGVVGLINNEGVVTACFYDSTKMDHMNTIDGVAGKPSSSFKSGEVAYLLQKGQDSEVWGQEIGKDTVPVFGGMKVYQYFDKDSAIYTNDADMEGTCVEHDFSQKVLTDQPNAKGLYAYVCANDASHISNYNVIKAYNGKDNLELDSTAEGEYFVESLDLKDDEPFNSPVDFTAKSFSYDRKPAAGIVTFMLPVDLTTEQLNGTAYYLKQFDGSTLKYKAASEIKANTPYVVKVNTPGDFLINDLTDVEVKATTSLNETTVGRATQFGSYVSTTIDNDANYDYYGYSEGKFFRAKVGVTITPFRTAVKLANSVLASGHGKPHLNPAELNIEIDEDEEATGIELTPAEIGLSGKVNVYDVLGHAIRVNVEAEGCLDGLQNGVYIVNGKKVIVRE